MAGAGGSTEAIGSIASATAHSVHHNFGLVAQRIKDYVKNLNQRHGMHLKNAEVDLIRGTAAFHDSEGTVSITSSSP